MQNRTSFTYTGRSSGGAEGNRGTGEQGVVSNPIAFEANRFQCVKFSTILFSRIVNVPLGNSEESNERASILTGSKRTVSSGWDRSLNQYAQRQN